MRLDMKSNMFELTLVHGEFSKTFVINCNKFISLRPK